MSERVFYESSSVRIEVERCPGSPDLGVRPTFMWWAGKCRERVDGDDVRYEYNGLHDTAEDALLEASGELLDADAPEFVVSRDQRTEVR